MVATEADGVVIAIENVDDLASLLRWRDAHQDLVRNFNPVYKHGIIEYGEGAVYRQEFTVLSDALIRHEYLAGGILKGFGFTYSRYTWAVTDVKGIITFYPVDFAIQDMITVHASVMAVLEHAKHFVKEVDGKLIIKVVHEENG
jgi:hypothetical protein